MTQTGVFQRSVVARCRLHAARLLPLPCLLLAMSSTAWADVITVGDDEPSADFQTIQAAVNFASDGDVVLVYPGTYTAADDAAEDAPVVDLMGKAITLRSHEGPEETVIDGEGERRGIVCMTSESETTIIDGFTIRNGHISGSGSTDTSFEVRKICDNQHFGQKRNKDSYLKISKRMEEKSYSVSGQAGACENSKPP